MSSRTVEGANFVIEEGVSKERAVKLLKDFYKKENVSVPEEKRKRKRE